MSETSFVFKYFPEGEPPSHLKSILEIFAIPETRIDSSQGRLSSNEVLSILRKDLENIGFRVETSKKKKDKIKKSVPWGENSLLNFELDAFQESTRTMLEVEAGATFIKNAFFRNLFRACIIPSTDYLVLAFRCTYAKRKNEFKEVCKHLYALYKSDRLKLPLKGILVIGY